MARSKKADAIQVINNETEEIREVNIYDLTKNAYLEFGNYINNWRQLPQIIDGLKISYRRLLYSALQYPQGKMVKSVMLLGKLSEIHPHSTEGSYGVICNYVKSGIFKGQGSFGVRSINADDSPAAAPRYTEVCVSDNYRAILGNLIKKVPYVESPVGPLEPSFIPSVVPVSLCLKSDTRVYLTDGRNLTMEEIDKEYKEGKENFVLTCNPDGDFSVSKIIWSDKTRVTNKYVRITLDDGSIIESTEDHRFMTRDGEFKEAKDLTIGESMMPGRIDKGEDGHGRAWIWNNYSMSATPVYHLSNMYNVAHGVYQYDPTKIMRHHIDKNPENDNPTNIIALTRSEHSKIHGHDPKIWTPRDYDVVGPDGYTERERLSLAQSISYEQNEQRRETSRQTRIKYNKSEKKRQELRDYWASEDGAVHKEYLGIINKERNSSPEFKEKIKKDFWDTDRSKGVRERIGAMATEMNRNPEIRRKQQRTKILKQFKHKINIENKSYDIAIDEIVSKRNFTKWFSNREDFIQAEKMFNHSIAKIEFIEDECTSDFYDITVDSRYHNFLLSTGIIAHNCLDSLVSGMGLAVSTDLPNFSAKSMYQAFVNDDPSLLEPNINIGMDKSKSELHKLWTEGKGRVCYYYHVSPIKGPDGNPGFLIEGDAGIFTPKLKRIKDWQAEGKVYIEDMITQDGAKLAIFKVPNIKSLSIDDLETEVRKICINNNTYNLNVSDGGSAFRIPLREWIKATYTNYINLVNQDNQDNIEQTKFDIKVYSNIEQVANYIINENPKAENDEIAQACGIEMEVVNAIMSRTISNLRKTKDQTEKVKALKAKLKELKAFDAVKFTEEIVNRL